VESAEVKLVAENLGQAMFTCHFDNETALNRGWKNIIVVEEVIEVFYGSICRFCN
jgi:hypothetical protein